MSLPKKLVIAPEQESAYADFMYVYNCYAIQWVSALGAIFCLAFIVIDYWRAGAFAAVILIRGTMVIIFGIIYLFSIKKRLSTTTILNLQLLVPSVFILDSFILDFFAAMPQFALTNSILLASLLSYAVFGFKLSSKLIQTVLVLTAFIAYTYLLSPHRSFHESQSFNLVTNSFFFYLIGYFIEQFKKFNFLQYDELRKLESELRSNEIYLRGILDSTDDGMLAVDNQGKVINSNNRFAELWHIPQKLIEQRDDHALLGHVLDQVKDPDWFLSSTQELYHSDKTSLDELEFKDGRIFERASTPLILNNKIVGRVWSFRDITARKEAQEKLRDSENKLRAFFRSTPDASVLLGKNLEILAFNTAGLELTVTTYGREFQIGDSFLELIFPQLRPVISSFLKKALQGETSQGEFPIPNIKTGKTVWWLSTFMPAFDSDGTIFGVVANSTNINEIKRAQLKIKRQFEELQKINNELDHFVYSASHDLRAPLASLLGLINIAEIENPSPSLQEYLNLMRKSINRLDGFIKDILDYSGNSRKDIQVEKIDFIELVNEVQSNSKMIIGFDRLHVNIQVQDTFIFYSDRERIEILLRNLFSNAIKYQDTQKESSVLTIEIVTTTKEASVKFTDNGIGIEAKHLSKIFDMFYRAAYNAKGSGLGLYIAKETIAKLGGTIRAQSEFGKQTTFEVLIPNAASAVSI